MSSVTLVLVEPLLKIVGIVAILWTDLLLNEERDLEVRLDDEMDITDSFFDFIDVVPRQVIISAYCPIGRWELIQVFALGSTLSEGSASRRLFS